MRKKILLYLFPVFSLFLCLLLTQIEVEAEVINYIYFDLACNQVVIDKDNYSGCVYQNIDGEVSSLEVSGKHATSNYYYVYQSTDSNRSTTGMINESIVVPTYESLNETIKGFINNTDVESVISAWRDTALTKGRVATGNTVSVSGSSTFNVTIDNLYSSHHVYGQGRTTGGVSYRPSGTSSLMLKLKGENRFGNIYYYTTTTTSSFEITSADGSGNTSGSLVVANIASNSNTNYYDSGIGGSDNYDRVYGLKISGGTIYVGTTYKDNCSAIGGGGNGLGHVTISGGIVTAVSSSTGTAIGGGIGQSSYGGDANVTISGGKVYAYNFGRNYNDVFVAGVAIGGGSSQKSTGNRNTTVKITGGEVYAQSVGGVAIGGGSSATLAGGPATIIIGEDAKVTAKSISGSYVYSGKTYEVAPGSGIGGGTGGTGGSGGTATVTISGGTVTSGTIGGGETNSTSTSYSVGDANVKITGGEVTGRVIMYNGTFEMTGGILKQGSSENGGCIQMYGGTATISGGEIKECKALANGGAFYIGGGTFNSKGGKIYNNTALNGAGVYIADGTINISNGSIENNKVSTGNGAGVYIGGNGNFIMTGGKIINNEVSDGNGGGVYIVDGTVNISSGSIESNKVSTGNGGGVYISGNGNFIMTGGEIIKNEASVGNGGGVYLDSGSYNMSQGIISENESVNGAGAYVTSATFNLTGGSFLKNVAGKNGGGFYIGDNSIVNLSDGEIGNNIALNGGGFYQTQNGNSTVTKLSGKCHVHDNEALNGNGGGVYIDGGSIFRIVGGKIVYNKAIASTMPSNLVLAKDSTSGVGGGVYILNGVFTMYDDDDTPGDAAIFGNIADYAADDLFASGVNTSFDAIKVVNMKKDDAYKQADSWFEDFPINESHTTLNYNHRNDDIASNDTIVSLGRYKNMEDVDDMIIASTVLHRNCLDYIAITMGTSVGNIKISVSSKDTNSIKAHSFVYKIESCSTDLCNDTNPEISMEVLVRKGIDTKIVMVPTGVYKVSIVPSWSWRYNEKIGYDVVENSVLLDRVEAKSVNINVYTDQFTEVNTLYNIENKLWFSEVFTIDWKNVTLGGIANE